MHGACCFSARLTAGWIHLDSENIVGASLVPPTFPTVFHPISRALRLNAAAEFNSYRWPRPLGGHLGSCSSQVHAAGADAKGSIQRSTEPPTALVFLPENSIRSSCHFQLLRLSRCVVIDPVNIFSCLTTRESSQRQQPVVVYLAPPFFCLSKLCFCLCNTELSQECESDVGFFFAFCLFFFFFYLNASSRGGMQPIWQLRKEEITRSRFAIRVLVSAKCVVADLADIWAGCITVANTLYVLGRAQRIAANVSLSYFLYYFYH